MSDFFASPGGPVPSYEDFVRLFRAHKSRVRAFLQSLLPAGGDNESVRLMRTRLLDRITSELRDQAP